MYTFLFLNLEFITKKERQVKSQHITSGAYGNEQAAHVFGRIDPQNDFVRGNIGLGKYNQLAA